MVDALPSDRAYEAFDIGSLPGRTRRGRSISDAERPKAPGDHRTINAVSIADVLVRVDALCATRGLKLGLQFFDRPVGNTVRRIIEHLADDFPPQPRVALALDLDER